MAHPLYYHARRLVGRPVTAYHVSGHVYCGVLHSVTPTGVYMLNCRQMGLVGFEETDSGMSPELLVGNHQEGASFETVYSPGGYFAFGALTGLTLGALASPYLW